MQGHLFFCLSKLQHFIPKDQITRTRLGNGNGFAYTIQRSIRDNPDDCFIYFVEDDYVHLPNSKKILMEGLKKASYVSLYDHLDKYMNPSMNPYIKRGEEQTRIFITNSTHWKYTNSTCMTFAARVKTLKKDLDIFLKYSKNIKIPADFKIFNTLIKNRHRSLISPIPGYATHGETKFMSPFRDWARAIHSDKMS